jgi:hypothetical protein
MMRVIHLSLAFLIASGLTAFAGELLSIGDILEDPQKFQLHVVSLKGVVRNFQSIEEPYFVGGLTCYEAYTFTLVDETGSLDVIVRGVCGKGKIEIPKVSNEDRVLIEALIQAPGQYRGDGLLLKGEDRNITQAIATKVVHLD